MLRNGLDAWCAAGLPTVPVENEERPDAASDSAAEPNARASAQSDRTFAFLPGLVESYANQQSLPVKRDLAVLFVDIADSTAAIVQYEPEQALAFVQRFMGVVTEAALAFCGDVKDYEGDGALLYFDSVAEATQAALEIRERLAQKGDGDEPLRARLSLDAGSIVIGVIGTPLRRSVALIGPSINRAARLLKQIPPGGIIATDRVVETLRAAHHALADRFTLLDAHLELKGFERETVTAYTLI